MLNECVPRKLKRELRGFAVQTVPERGWSSRLDGGLLQAADADEYDAFVTVDRNLVYQQNLAGFQLGVVVLIARGNSLRFLQPLAPELREVLAEIGPGEVVYVPRPHAA